MSPSNAQHGHSKDAITLTDQTNLLPFKKIMAVFAGLSLCIVVSTLDSVIAATALPTISSYFNAGSVISWVPASYLLTSTAFQPMYGRFSDIFGRKAALGLSMTIFMIGNLAAGFSKTIIQLIVFRGISGAGGGGIISLAQIVISDVVSLRERGKYQGIIGGVVVLGYAIGPVLGGVISQKVSWRWCFWITLPVSLGAMLIVMFVLPLKAVEGNIRKKLLAIDYLGAVLTLIGCALISLPLIWGGVTFPWSSPIVLAPLFSGFFVVFIFCIWEWKGAKLPIIPMYIFKHKTVTGVYITVFVNGFVFFSSLFYLPQFFQVGLGYSPTRSGLFLIPVLCSMTATSFVVGQIVSRTGIYRPIIYLGFGLWAIGTGLLSTVTIHSPKALQVFYMLMAGVGAGCTWQTTTVAAQASVPRKDMSVVTAVRNFMRLLGGTLSLSLGSTIVNNSLQEIMSALSLSSSAITTITDDPSILGSPTSSTLASLGISPADATLILTKGYSGGFRTLFIVNASLCAFAVVVSLLLIGHEDLIRGDEEKLKEEAKGALTEKSSANSSSTAVDDLERGRVKDETSPKEETSES